MLITPARDIGTWMLVSVGRPTSASGVSSMPITLRSLGHLDTERGRAGDDAQCHQVVVGDHRGGARGYDAGCRGRGRRPPSPPASRGLPARCRSGRPAAGSLPPGSGSTRTAVNPGRRRRARDRGRAGTPAPGADRLRRPVRRCSSRRTRPVHQDERGVAAQLDDVVRGQAGRADDEPVDPLVQLADDLPLAVRAAVGVGQHDGLAAVPPVRLGGLDEAREHRVADVRDDHRDGGRAGRRAPTASGGRPRRRTRSPPRRSMIRRRVSRPIRSGSLNARDAVDNDTPARCATSVRVGFTARSRGCAKVSPRLRQVAQLCQELVQLSRN